MMRRIVMLIMCMCMSYGFDAQAMEWAWRNYVGIRDSAVIEALNKTAAKNFYDNINEKDKPQIVIESNKLTQDRMNAQAAIEDALSQYQKPWYVRWGAMFSKPVESEQERLKKLYQQYSDSFNNTFYPKGDATLFANVNADIQLEIGKLQSAINTALFNRNITLSATNFDNLIRNTKTLILGIQPNLTKEEDINRFKAFKIEIDSLLTLKDKPIVTALEQWHRDNLKDRLERYFKLK